MNNVLTLIAAKPRDISTDIARLISERLHGLGAKTGTIDWLAESEACDIPFSGLPPEEAEMVARSELMGKPVDMAAQPIRGRRKKLLLADMDSTLVTSETLDELADYAGLKDQISAITARAMNGEILFRDALVERVAMLEGLSIDCMDKTMRQVTYSPGAGTLVRTMHANGAYTALASGGFRFFTKRVQEALGFDFEIGNEIEIINGKITGRLIGDTVTKTVKHETLIALAQKNHIGMAETLAVGDGANDLPMLQAAGLGVAYHAKPVVIEHARYHLDHAGLDALLYIQGYRRSEFVT